MEAGWWLFVNWVWVTFGSVSVYGGWFCWLCFFSVLADWCTVLLVVVVADETVV
jgi:hypothetical protein